MSTKIDPVDIGDPQELHELRKAVVSLDKNQTAITVVLQNVSNTLKAFRDEFHILETRVTEGSRTKWSNIYGAVGVGTTLVLILGGIVSYFYSDNISRNDSRLGIVSEKLEHHTEDGHPATVAAAILGLRELMEARVESFTDIIKEGNVTSAQGRQRTREELSRVEKDINDRVNRLESALEAGLYKRVD